MPTHDPRRPRPIPGPDMPLSDLARLAITAVAQNGVLPDGAVLLEGPIADRLGMSRAPVRMALQKLAEDGIVHRFEGRGYLLGQRTAPIRVDLRAIDWANAVPDIRRRPATLAPDKIVEEIRTQIVAHIPFGRYRVHETALALTFDVSRAVAREALFHLFKSGLIEKDARSHWIAGPLTAEMARAQFALRTILEPAALRLAAPMLDRDQLTGALRFIASLDQHDEPLSVAALDRLERDLHETCLARCPNGRLLDTIRQNTLPNAANRLFFETLPRQNGAAIIADHHAVLSALVRGQTDQACDALRTHLDRAAERTVIRLKILSILPPPTVSPFLSPTGPSS